MNTTDEIRGHLVPLRALEVALAGGHSIVLYGPQGVGKRTLRACFPDLNAQVIQTCLCGMRGSVQHTCVCDETRLARYDARVRRRTQHTQMCIEVCAVPFKAMQAPCETGRHAAMLARATEAKLLLQGLHDFTLDEPSRRILEMASRRTALTVGQYDNVINVGRTIAYLARSARIEPRHIVEAVQYSTALLWRERPRDRSKDV